MYIYTDFAAIALIEILR